jgi:hypothetical protein
LAASILDSFREAPYHSPDQYKKKIFFGRLPRRGALKVPLAFGTFDRAARKNFFLGPLPQAGSCDNRWRGNGAKAQALLLG